MQARLYSSCRRMSGNMRYYIKLLICLTIIHGGGAFIESSFGEDWRSDENVYRILSSRSEHAIPIGLLPEDRRLEFSELCVLHLSRHVAEDHLLTDHQLVNLLGWITRTSFNDAVIYLDALLAKDISGEQKSRVMAAIQRSMHGPARMSPYTSIASVRHALEVGVLRTEEARLSVAFALATNGDEVGVAYVAKALSDPDIADDLRTRAAIFAVRDKLPIAAAYVHCENIINCDDIAIGIRAAAANELMRNGIRVAIEWSEQAIALHTISDTRRIRLLEGLVSNGKTKYLKDLVPLLGSKQGYVASDARLAIFNLFGAKTGVLGNIQDIDNNDLQSRLLKLIQESGERLKWDSETQSLVAGD